VVIAVYAKKYDAQKSSVEINPVRLVIKLYFPANDQWFEMDTELRGVSIFCYNNNKNFVFD